MDIQRPTLDRLSPLTKSTEIEESLDEEEEDDDEEEPLGDLLASGAGGGNANSGAGATSRALGAPRALDFAAEALPLTKSKGELAIANGGSAAPLDSQGHVCKAVATTKYLLIMFVTSIPIPYGMKRTDLRKQNVYPIHSLARFANPYDVVNIYFRNTHIKLSLDLFPEYRYYVMVEIQMDVNEHRFASIRFLAS
jgi:hypothetical protein